MKSGLIEILVAVCIAVSLASMTAGLSAEAGCCSCACPPGEGSAGFDTCTDIAGSESICTTFCKDQNCSYSFFLNGTTCSDPSLAETCDAGDGTMAPVAAPLGLAALAALLSGVGILYLRKR